MKSTRNYEVLAKRITKLKEMGFSCIHDDIMSIEIQPEHHGFPDKIKVDFSATSEEFFFQKAFEEIYKAGIAKGKQEIRGSLKNVIFLI